MKPLIAIVGQSGTGKTTSLRNLPKGETIIIDCERKGFPFPEDGWNIIPVKNVGEFDKALAEALSGKYRFAVVESFTKMAEIISATAETIYKNWDIWSWYNKKITEILEKVKNEKTTFIFTAIDEVVTVPTPEGGQEAYRRIAVQGKKWEGKVDKEFLVVLYTKIVKRASGIEHVFVTKTDGVTTAKAPMVLGLPEVMPNDLSLVIKEMEKIYKI